MNFATWSIRNPIPAIVLLHAADARRALGFRALNIQNFPDMDFPAVTRHR